MKEFELKYGCNPNQKPARIYMEGGAELPVQILCGRPGYINFLDAFNSWQLVRELCAATGLPCGGLVQARQPHERGAGSAAGREKLKTRLLRLGRCRGAGRLRPCACAYARARGTDRMSILRRLDRPVGRMRRDDGEAHQARGVRRHHRARAMSRRRSRFCAPSAKAATTLCRLTPTMSPPRSRCKQVFGVTFEQGHNNCRIDEALLEQARDRRTPNLPASAKRDLHCRAHHAEIYPVELRVLRRWTDRPSASVRGSSPASTARALPAARPTPGTCASATRCSTCRSCRTLGRAERDNVIDGYINKNEEDVCAEGIWQKYFQTRPEPLTAEEAAAYLARNRRRGAGLGRVLPLQRQHRARAPQRRALHRPARRLHPRRRGDRLLRQVRNGHGLYGSAAVPPLTDRAKGVPE